MEKLVGLIFVIATVYVVKQTVNRWMADSIRSSRTASRRTVRRQKRQVRESLQSRLADLARHGHAFGSGAAGGAISGWLSGSREIGDEEGRTEDERASGADRYGRRESAFGVSLDEEDEEEWIEDGQPIDPRTLASMERSSPWPEVNTETIPLEEEDRDAGIGGETAFEAEAEAGAGEASANSPDAAELFVPAEQSDASSSGAFDESESPAPSGSHVAKRPSDAAAPESSASPFASKAAAESSVAPAAASLMTPESELRLAPNVPYEGRLANSAPSPSHTDRPTGATRSSPVSSSRSSSTGKSERSRRSSDRASSAPRPATGTIGASRPSPFGSSTLPSMPSGPSRRFGETAPPAAGAPPPSASPTAGASAPTLGADADGPSSAPGLAALVGRLFSGNVMGFEAQRVFDEEFRGTELELRAPIDRIEGVSSEPSLGGRPARRIQLRVPCEIGGIERDVRVTFVLAGTPQPGEELQRGTLLNVRGRLRELNPYMLTLALDDAVAG